MQLRDFLTSLTFVKFRKRGRGSKGYDISLTMVVMMLRSCFHSSPIGHKCSFNLFERNFNRIFLILVSER